MDQIQRIFAAIDFSPSSDEALRQAAERAAAAHGKLAVCHIVPNELRSNLLFPQFTERESMAVPVEVERAGEAVLKRVGEIVGRTRADVEIIADHGSPYAEILRRAEAWKADLIVVGSHGMTAADGILLGSVTAKVIRYAHSPVLVARKPRASGHIVAGTDFSDPALPAVEAAVNEARRTNAQLTIIHSLDVYRTTPTAGAMELAPLAISDEIYKDMEKYAGERLADILKKFGMPGHASVARGPAALALVTAAADLNAELLVVGTVGRTGLTRLLLGSVAEAVASNAPCSVLIVRIHRA
jgi:nucleotide-binding universal stress UspA family protein